VLIILLIAISVMSIGLIIATPVWMTQIQREKEEELIFRGNQYVEAVRIYQMKYPGKYPKSLEELLKEKCLRKLYPDPMTKHGKWDIILHQETLTEKKEQSVQKVMIAPQEALSSLENPHILGVVSSSRRKSIKIYQKQEFYNLWLFFYGKDPQKLPEIVYYGKERAK